MLFQEGEQVEWTSQAAGHSVTKTGVVYKVVRKGVRPCDEWLEVTCPGVGDPSVEFGPHGKRNEESYLVRVGNKLYWPRTKWLKRAQSVLPKQEALPAEDLRKAVTELLQTMEKELISVYGSSDYRFATRKWKAKLQFILETSK